MTSLVSYILHAGDDLLVVNAARVSLKKFKFIFEEDDQKLLLYLAKHKHRSPFYHPKVTLYVRCPIFVARQWQRHRIGMDFNEISGRYVEFEEEYFKPEVFRKGSPSIKQGSLSEEVNSPPIVSALYEGSCQRAFEDYQKLLELGVCREQARAVLPLALFTEFYVTGSLYAWWHFYELRMEAHAQKEIRNYAEEVEAIVSSLFPASWGALKNAAKLETL